MSSKIEGILGRAPSSTGEALWAIGRACELDSVFRDRLYTMARRGVTPAPPSNDDADRVRVGLEHVTEAMLEALTRMREIGARRDGAEPMPGLAQDAKPVRHTSRVRGQKVELHKRDLMPQSRSYRTAEWRKCSGMVHEALEGVLDFVRNREEVYGLNRLEEAESPYVSSQRGFVSDALVDALEKEGLFVDPYDLRSLEAAISKIEPYDAWSGNLLDWAEAELERARDNPVRGVAYRDKAGKSVFALPVYHH